MLQRIQTLYLILVAGMLCGFIYLPIAALDTNSMVILNLYTWIIIVMNVVTIFLFKNRRLQMRLCILIIFLLIVLETVGLYMVYHIKSDMNPIFYRKIAIIFPILGIVFTYLAFRGIKKDDQLVKSYERLR